MSNLSLKESLAGEKTILKLAGELDAKTSTELKLKLESIASNGRLKLVCNCSDLEYIASAGIGILNSMAKYFKEKGGEIVFSNLRKEIRDTMELMYFTKKVRVFLTEEEALKAL